MALQDYYKFIKKHSHLIIELKRHNLKKLKIFYNSYKKYKYLNGVEVIQIEDIYPCIYDNTETSHFDSHYFYQGVWAFKKIMENGIKNHLDIGSEIKWVGLLSTITKVTFIDIRPFKTDLSNLLIKKGDILSLPYENNSIKSLSCLHVAEHIGLGRYGDNLDPDGTKKACKELSRILVPGGNLYFSVPVGEQKTYFNAHRVHYPQTILNYFEDLDLVELSGVTDADDFIVNIDVDLLKKSKYACGLFWFKKDEKK